MSDDITRDEARRIADAADRWEYGRPRSSMDDIGEIAREVEAREAEDEANAKAAEKLTRRNEERATLGLPPLGLDGKPMEEGEES